MSDDLTPVPSAIRCSMHEQRLDAMHDRVNEIRSIQIEVCGRDGRNGKLLQLKVEADKMTENIEANQKAILAIASKTERMGFKLTLIVSGIATVASVIGGVVVKLLVGT